MILVEEKHFEPATTVVNGDMMAICIMNKPIWMNKEIDAIRLTANDVVFYLFLCLECEQYWIGVRIGSNIMESIVGSSTKSVETMQ